ncbi:MAG: UDP-N-acetylmuramoyl-L-alanine--D-glutamate ligase [Solirubrobacterales bacterium]
MPAPGPKPRPPAPEGPFLVVGLARSGAAIATVLAERGERVIGTDSGHPDQARRLVEAGVEVHLDGPGTDLLPAVSTVVKSPGVPNEAPVVAAARSAGVEVVGELELAWRLLPNRFIGVTGTNGKTTVAEWIGHIYAGAELPVAVAGNVGSPLSGLVGSVDPDATVVAEASSFQLEDATEFAPECGVFLNISQDHLDRHGSMESYLDAKLRIFARQDADDFAVARAGDATDILAWEERDFDATLITYCSRAEREGCAMSAEGGELRWHGKHLVDVADLPLAGPHNVENAMAAGAAALSLGVDTDAVASGLRSFAGVPHRLERVGNAGGVTYVNDSKATNPSASAAAIESFEAPVRVILGGSLKGGGFSDLVEPVAAHCVACYLIGEAAARIESDLAGPLEEGSATVPLRNAGSLPEAVRAATEEADAGDVVLLAPACASFDAYRDFEERGDHFRELVGAAAAHASSAGSPEVRESPG